MRNKQRKIRNKKSKTIELRRTRIDRKVIEIK